MKFSILSAISLVLAASSAVTATPVPPTYPTFLDKIWLSNGRVKAAFIPFGAIITNFIYPDKDGIERDLILGWNNTYDYWAQTQLPGWHGAQYWGRFGGTIGRVANFISGASFVLDGVKYNLTANVGNNTLHSDFGFDLKNWTVTSLEYPSEVTFRYFSPNLEEGYPGNLVAYATFRITPDDTWELEFDAECDEDTIINMTNHGYWNLAGWKDNGGNETMLDNVVWIDSDQWIPSPGGIPTGEIRSLDLDPWLDFRVPKTIGRDIGSAGAAVYGGQYNNGLLFKNPGVFPENPQAWAWSPETGIKMELRTTQATLQFYTGCSTIGPRKDDQIYGPNGTLYYVTNGCFCFEAENKVDDIHHPEWPAPSVILRKGQHYYEKTSYAFSVSARQPTA